MAQPSEVLCDIVIPIWNQPELTRRCLESVLRCTAEPIRLILIDNGSEAPTRELLARFEAGHASFEAGRAGFEAARPAAVRLIRNDVNRGFIQATNQGIRAGDAPWVCLLNNDTRVTHGWLEELIRVAQSDPAIGLVNPTSNSLGLKLARPASKLGNRSLEAVAADLRKETGRWEKLATALGFCLLARRSLFDRVGLLDESYGMGNFDDDDLSQRVRQAGFICVRACASTVYHEEKASFRALPGWEKAFKDNRIRFEQRWGRKLRILWGPAVPSACLEAVAAAGHWVCVVGPASDGGGPRFKHAQVEVLEWPGRSWRRKAAWRLIAKRKKPFDLVVSHDPTWSRWIRRLRVLHRAGLLDNPTEKEILERCRELSRSRSGPR